MQFQNNFVYSAFAVEQGNYVRETKEIEFVRVLHSPELMTSVNHFIIFTMDPCKLNPSINIESLLTVHKTKIIFDFSRM